MQKLKDLSPEELKKQKADYAKQYYHKNKEKKNEQKKKYYEENIKNINRKPETIYIVKEMNQQDQEFFYQRSLKLKRDNRLLLEEEIDSAQFNKQYEEQERSLALKEFFATGK